MRNPRNQCKNTLLGTVEILPNTLVMLVSVAARGCCNSPKMLAGECARAVPAHKRQSKHLVAIGNNRPGPRRHTAVPRTAGVVAQQMLLLTAFPAPSKNFHNHDCVKSLGRML